MNQTNQVTNQDPRYSYKEIIGSAKPKRDQLELGWHAGVKEAVFVVQMANSRFAIYRQSNMTIKSGYRTYDTMEDLEEDFELFRETRRFAV